MSHTENIMSYPAHPAADIFPLIQGHEFDALVIDIRENGLLDPIVLCDGQVLDGRNRLRACEVAGIAPVFRDVKPPDPVRYVISANIHRRHLSTDQRAAIAAELATMRHGTNRYEKKVEAQFCVSTEISIDEAAEQMNVSPRTINNAKKRMRDDPEAHEAAKRGEKVKKSTSRAAGDYWLRVAGDAYTQATGSRRSDAWISRTIKPVLSAALPWFAGKDPRSLLNDEQAVDVRRVVLEYTYTENRDDSDKTAGEAREARETLSLSAQQKLDRAIALEKRVLEHQFDERLKQRLDEILPTYAEEYARYKKFSDSYVGVFREEEYRAVLSCLHPDRCPKDRTSQFERAFHLVKSKEDILCGGKTSKNPSTLPSSVAELMARRRSH